MLSVKNLTKQFKDFKAVQEVSFDVQDGEIFGLLGPNGAGKTTIIRTIATVLAPTQGTAEVLGFDIIKD
ncbi:ATP-binding cassette domain-containing protein, partial [Candidatus Parcubacteria bacterium]|nr:ATP-binding cassette domain-containing protein [Candidatus Parcubacteria bacterium]